MGQATLTKTGGDLPDLMREASESAPTASAAPAAMASADDLLSQLAGDDIDRLLAEAHAEEDQPRRRTPPRNSAQPEPSQATAAEVAPAFEKAPETGTLPKDEAALAALLSDQPLAAPAPAAQAVTPAEPAPAEAPHHPQQDRYDAEAEIAAEIAAELDAGRNNALSVTKAVAAPQLELPPGPADRDSLPLRILEWINAPLLFVSDEVRDAMGKMALLTTFNAIAVLVYVIVFRKPPHH